MESPQSVARRSITSVTWNAVSNLVYAVIGFVRTLLLARWLPVEVFGIYALASSVTVLSGVLANFGMGGAFLHRAPETEDEDHAAAIHFTLKFGFTLTWAVIMATAAFVLSDGQTRVALLTLTATTTGLHLSQTPQTILVRRVMHRRLALIQLIDAVLTTVVALGLAYSGATLWALLANNIVSVILTLVLLYLWQPVWKPRFEWSPQVVRYFLRFGSNNLLSVLLSYSLDRVDDLWTGLILGKAQLGYYSRAYSFATYPRALLAGPINMVARGTYAELKGDRRRLSEAFVRFNSLLVHTGFFFAGLITLVAPEFIRIALGERWLPMLDAFRLMLVFTLFDPMKATIADLFLAMGMPEQVAQIRFVQLTVMIVGIVLLSPIFGIAGVALAVDVMLVTGMGILLCKARRFVDFSIKNLFAVPAVALLLGLLLSYQSSTLPWVVGSDWRSGFIKAVVFFAIYTAVLFALESRQLRETFLILKGILSTGPATSPQEFMEKAGKR